MKTLYLEGAGCVPRGDLENCRVRGAFRTDAGTLLYLEMTAFQRTNANDRRGQLKKKYGNFIGVIQHLKTITGPEFFNVDGYHMSIPGAATIPAFISYSHAGLLEFINGLGCSFDQIKVVNDWDVYHVHAHGDEMKRAYPYNQYNVSPENVHLGEGAKHV